MTQYFGKYRGKVEDNRDNEQRGRLRVSVPAILPEGWAEPCTPYGGPGVGLFALPPVGANVWVEFEGGYTNYPIWTGCFWGTGEAPITPAQPEKKVLKTATATITLDDTPGAGGITIETASGMKIALTAQGIEINDGAGGSIKLTSTQVSVNEGALEVI